MAACSTASPQLAPVPSLTLIADVDGDGAPDVVDLFQSHDRERAILARRLPDREPVVSRLYPLWSLWSADLDGDGRDSLLVGAWTRVHRHDEPEPHRTVWVVDWGPGGFRDTWRGSALARPLRDFRPTDLDADGVAELLALETAAEGCMATAYGWSGFGFVGLGRLEVACDEAHFCAGSAVALCRSDGTNTRTLAVRRGRLYLQEAGEAAVVLERRE